MARRAPMHHQPASRCSGGGEGSGAAALVQPFQFSNLPRCVSASAPARLNCWQPLPRAQGLLWLRRGGLLGCAACSRQLRWHPAARRPGQLLVPPFPAAHFADHPQPCANGVLNPICFPLPPPSAALRKEGRAQPPPCPGVPFYNPCLLLSSPWPLTLTGCENASDFFFFHKFG